MTSAKRARNDIRHLVANVLSETEVLESTFEATSLGTIVSEQARRHGSKVAIEIFERNERATYAEVDRKSNQYAHALRAFGVRKGDRVGVMLPNRLEFPMIWFAIAKLGAVLVPINTSYTQREVANILNDTGVKFAVVDESVSSALLEFEPWPTHLSKERVILVGHEHGAPSCPTLDSLVEGISDSPVDAEVHPEDLLNIQYTSGTTGFPKGCMLTHEYWSVTSYVFAHYDEDPYRRNLSWSPLYYTFGQMELMKSFRQGATLFLAQKLSSSRLLDWVREYRIEYCDMPESVALQVDADDETLTCLKQVGQVNGWNTTTTRQFRERTDIFASNPFAMTEIGWGTQAPQQLQDTVENAGAVGLRAPFRELELVAEDGSPTPIGDVGELRVKGRGIFEGYWRRPEANAQLFQDEWFRTGDLMRRDDLGFYFFVGRTKDMIRRSGENISAHEVEAVFSEIPEVAAAAAVPVPDSKRGEEVKVYVELSQGLTPNDALLERIFEHAASRLAPFKQPRYIAFVPVIPRTVTSNKLLKRELTNPRDPLAGAYDRLEKRWN